MANEMMRSPSRRFIVRWISGSRSLTRPICTGRTQTSNYSGRALRGHRQHLVIATKFGILRDPARPDYRGISGKPDYVHKACEGSLRRLGVDMIDLYYQHRVDPKTPIEETVDRCGT
jgi:aryl-alcohol dehydrogenase-like predicted oxidoreductase